jgi:formate hydrogenlyase subunit 4
VKPPETKVAATGAVGVLVSAVLQLIQTYDPTVHLPAAGTISLILTALVTLAGYLAPHTSIPEDIAQAEKDVEEAINHNQVKILHQGTPSAPPPVSPDASAT